MKTFKTVISGYSVELQTELEDDPSTQCDVWKGDYSASLACLMDTGVLSDGYNDHTVPRRALALIELWADENGY